MFKELVNDLISQYNNDNWQSAAIVSVLILVVGLTVHFIFFRILKRISKKSDNPLLEHLWDKFKNPSFGLILTIALSIILLAFAPDNQLIDIVKHLLKLIIIFYIT